MKRLYFFSFLLVLSSLALGVSTLHTAKVALRPPEGYAGVLYASTLALYGTKDGTTRFLCTTEPFEKIHGGYHLVSAGHCVQLVPADVKFSVADDIGGPLTPVTVLKAYDGDGLDFSEFELKTSRKYSLFVIGDEHHAHVGDAVISPNFSVGLVKQLSLGVVSSDLMPVTSNCPVNDCAGYFLVQMYGAPGLSGSAIVLARNHEVIGIAVEGFSDPIGFGVQPISAFPKFLAGPSQPHPEEPAIP